MRQLLRWLNKKGISTDAFVIILLVVGLAIAIALFVYFIMHGKDSSDVLFNISSGFEESSGFLS